MLTFCLKKIREYKPTWNALSSESDCLHYLLHKNIVLPE